MPPWIEIEGRTAIARVGPDVVTFQSPTHIEVHGCAVVSEVEVREGDELHFILSYQSYPYCRKLQLDPGKLIDTTRRYWHDWINRFERRTDWPEAVETFSYYAESTYLPTFGRNYCCANDVAAGGSGTGDELGLSLLLAQGCHLHIGRASKCRISRGGRRLAGLALARRRRCPEKMRIMYRLDGMRRLEEWVPHWLPGFRWSPPVRVGNAAAQQLQLDVFGEVLDTLHLAARGGIKPSEQALKLQDAIVQHVAAIWRLPDRGLLGIARQTSPLRLLEGISWVAIDRYVSGKTTAGRLDHAASARMQALRALMHQEICREGFDQFGDISSRTMEVSPWMQSLLLLPMVGFLPAGDERVTRTIAAIERDLVEDGLVRRRRSHGERQEGAFLACSCWLAECQNLQGRHQDARATFERLLAVRNDLGLLAEEYDNRAHHLAGNFPQALSHLALVQTALALCGPIEGRGDHVH